jgi:hypothetical protein
MDLQTGQVRALKDEASSGGSEQVAARLPPQGAVSTLPDDDAIVIKGAVVSGGDDLASLSRNAESMQRLMEQERLRLRAADADSRSRPDPVLPLVDAINVDVASRKTAFPAVGLDPAGLPDSVAVPVDAHLQPLAPSMALHNTGPQGPGVLGGFPAVGRGRGSPFSPLQVALL